MTLTYKSWKWVIAVSLAVLVIFSSPLMAHADEVDVRVSNVKTKLSEAVEHYRKGDKAGALESWHQARDDEYHNYLEDHIRERLGARRADAITERLRELASQMKSGSIDPAKAKAESESIGVLLTSTVHDLKTAPELQNRWTKVAKRLTDQLDNVVKYYAQGDDKAALKSVDNAYLGEYESGGLEPATQSFIGMDRKNEVEAKFGNIKQAIRHKAELGAVQQQVNALKQMIIGDAASIDGQGNKGSFFFFISSFLILLREGAEALLVVAGVVTYLVKSNRRDQLPGVYWGVVAAIGISAILAVVFNQITGAATGMSQELLEGVAGLLAVAMLLYVSNWILSKSQGQAWEQYVKGKVADKAKRGGVFALIAVSFIAVLREGAETILFYVPIVGGAKSAQDSIMIWLGIAAAALVLAIVFVMVRFFGIRLPLKPFFAVTSILLSLMAVIIVGGAMKEFQDAFANFQAINSISTIQWLGIYPYLQTLLAQLFVLALVIALGVVQFTKNRKLVKLNSQ